MNIRFNRALQGLMLFLTLLIYRPVMAVDIDLMHYAVADLQTGESTSLEQFRGKPTILLIFEPGCRYCARQARILNGMLDNCSDFQAVAIGLNGSRRNLR